MTTTPSPRLVIFARLDEVPIIGQFTIDAYIRDQLKFKAYKPNKYTDAFLTALVAKQTAVNEIVNPEVLTAELKQITLSEENAMLSLREPMNLLEGYVNDAVGLTVAKKDFGISAVRKKVTSGDAEGLNSALSTLLTNITKNFTKLEDQGYTADAKTALADTKQKIFDDKAAQKVKEDERADLVVNNMDVINDFAGDIKGIWKDGKLQFKVNEKVKLKDYTNAQIVKRIRNDELHTLIVGVVKNKFGGLEKDAKLKARPLLDGKRGKTVKSGPDAMYELKGLKPTTYIITVTFKDGQSFVVSGVAVTNTTVTLNIEQPK